MMIIKHILLKVMKSLNNYILKIICSDKPGIIAEVSNFLYKNKFNILESSQFKDNKNNKFFMRVNFCPILPNTQLKDTNKLLMDFKDISSNFKMSVNLYDMTKKQNALIMVSKFGHCLNNILYQWKLGSLKANIPIIVSNHQDMREIVEQYGIKFIHLPVNKKNKVKQEKKLLKIIKENDIELIVLARYMQVLSKQMCNIMKGKIINIHHSFLPSFKGARPYNQAYIKGVKIIGATAHYVTENLDEGQIIEQDVARVNHTKTLDDFISIGRDIENIVLYRAINWHIQHRVLMNNNQTIVFN